MIRKTWVLALTAALACAGTAAAGTFGKVISIGGESVDLALDEARGVMYVADFTGSRIDVISLTTNTVKTTFNVPHQPSSISVSPDDHWLLVANYGNIASPGSQTNSVSLIDLTNNYAQQVFSLPDVPLGVAFGNDGNALIVTASSFVQFNPSTGSFQTLQSLAQVVTNAIPQNPAEAPLQFTQATITASRDGSTIAGFGGTSPYLVFRYSVATQTIYSSFYISSPPGGPRVVSLADDGSRTTMAWWMTDANLVDIAEFLDPLGTLQVGSHVIDSSRNLVYAQVPSGTTGTTSTPVLKILSGDNLTVIEQLQLQENLTGKSVLNNAHSVMYSVSQSGVTMLPVGSLNTYHRIAISASDVYFHGSFCNRNSTTQTFTISDPGGNATHFAFASPLPSGVSVSPASGTTPATIRVTIDPNVFASQTGTVLTSLTVTSPDNTVIDVPTTIRVAVNSAQPAQRGASIDIPGTVVDVMADPKRPAYYAVRQDQNQVMVFNSANNTQMATLRTCTKPTSMAVTFDQQYLMVGCDAAHIIQVYDLDLLQEVGYVSLPSEYVESLAVTNNAILAYTRSAADGSYGIDSIDIVNGGGGRLPSLGVWNNGTLATQGILAASQNGANAIFAGSDGLVLIYSSVAGTFVSAQSNFTSLSGSAAASNYNQFVAGANLLDSSGTPVAVLGTSGGSPSGFAFLNQTGYFTTAPAVVSGAGQSGPGTISQVDPTTGNLIQPTPMLESPLLGNVSIGVGGFPFQTCSTTTTNNGANTTTICNQTVGGVTTTTTTTCTGVGSGSSNCQTQTAAGPANTTVSGFSRTVAVLNDQSAIINLTTSGLTVLPMAYASSIAPPSISAVVSAADSVSAPAPGGLISLYGTQLSPTNLATNSTPLPTALANSCVAVNGQPIPVIFTSPTQINGQMPSLATGNVTVQVLTPAGTSPTFSLTVPPNSPSVFLSGSAGPVTNLPTVVSAEDGLLITDANPIHRGDTLVIYLTGLGNTSPTVPDGMPSPVASVLVAPTVTLGGTNLSISYAGLAPGEVGVNQINVVVPSSAPQGLSVPLVITQGGATNTVNLRVVQ